MTPRHNHWSGLAPAVDAHLALWDRADRAKAGAIELAGTMWDDSGTFTPIERKMRAEQLLNVQHLRRWTAFAMTYGVIDGDGVKKSWSGMIEGSTIAGRQQYVGDRDQVLRIGGALAQREHSMLSKAITHYVSAEIVADVTDAAALAQCDPLFETDLFTPHGLVILETPLLINDLDPDLGTVRDDLWLGVRAIGWHRHGGIVAAEGNTIHPGITLFIYTTPRDYEEIYLTSMRAAGYPVEDSTELSAHELICTEVIPWAFGADWDINDSTDFVPGFLPSPVAAQRRWFHTFMRFCWQQIILPHKYHPKRAESRRWERYANRKEMLDYTTLRLRRLVEPFAHHSSGMGVPLERRVKVRPFWRDQFFPSLGPARLPNGQRNPESHRMIWIESFWRGPEDGPIGALHSATSVIR